MVDQINLYVYNSNDKENWIKNYVFLLNNEMEMRDYFRTIEEITGGKRFELVSKLDEEFPCIRNEKLIIEA